MLTNQFDKNRWPTLSWPLESPRLRVISMGAGLDTTALALMAARGEIGPMPDCAIFSDTGGEPSRVYRHLDWLEKQIPFPLYRVRRDGLQLRDYQAESAILPQKGRSATIPLYYKDPKGMGPKQCSKEFKTRVVGRKVMELLGMKPGERGPSYPIVEQWIGMDRGELERVKTSEKKWVHNRYPLIERDMRRHNVIRWMEERQYPTNLKSSCRFCPFRDDDAWADMKENEPEDFELACQDDEAFRPGYLGMTGMAYVHWSRVPLREARFDLKKPQTGVLFGMNECGAVCDGAM